MNKKLLLSFITGFGITSMMATNPQNLNKVTKVSKMPRASITRADSEYSLQSYNLNPSAPASPMAMPTGPISLIEIGSSPNLYTAIVSQSNCLTADQNINTVMFTRRRNVTTIGNSGFVQVSVSTNGGSTFDSLLTVVGDATDQHLCRYPNGTIVNPPGNTNPANAFAAVSGPWHPGADWQGNFFGTAKLSGTNVNNVFIDNNNLAGAQKSDFARISAQSTDNGMMYVMGGFYGDANGTTAIAQDYKSAVLHSGKLNQNTNTFSWTARTFPHPFRKDPADGTFNVFTTALCAWSQDGQVGYVVYTGQDSATYNNLKTYQPIVYKTNNGGISWNFMPMFDFSTLTNLTNALRATSAGTKRPFFTQGSGFDITVDANYNLHIVSAISSASSDDQDSLDFTWNIPKIIADVYTTPTGWQAQVLDSLMTDEVADGDSPWQASDGSGGNGWDARIQISRSQDGKRIFYGWMDTDSTWAVTTNQFPDIYAKGMNIETGYLTPTLNFTSGDVATHGKMAWLYMQSITLKNNQDYDLGFTTSTSYDNTFDALSGVKHYYVKGVKFNESEFIVPGNITCTAYSANVNVSTPDTCSAGNGTASANVVNGSGTSYLYSWNGSTASSSAVGTNLTTGGNFLSVVDNNNCITTATFVMTDYGSATSINSTPTPTSNCNATDGSATVVGFPTDTYTYVWNTTIPQTGATASNLAASTYEVTLTSSVGCTSAFEVIIPAGGLPTVNCVPTNITCNGGTNGSAIANTVGGAAPFTYAWSNGQDSIVATGLGVGTYSVQITDANGCSTSSQVSITQPAPIVLETAFTWSNSGAGTSSCTVTPSGGAVAPFTYSWNTDPVQTTATATGINNTNYTVTVTDANNCTSTKSVNAVGLVKQTKDNALRFYPNPTTGIVYLEIAKEFGLNLNIVVTSIDGSIISNTSATNNAIQTVDLNNLSKGLYFVKISSGSNSRTLKVTKM